jgi:hypothetical protein
VVGAIPAKEGRELDQIRSGGASGGGEEAVGSWNLGGVERSQRNPARSVAVGSVVARSKKRKQARKRGSGQAL